MGDVLTLIEKAQSAVDEQKALEMAQKLKEQSFDMNDLLEQMQQIHQMGSLSQVISMFPGAGKVSDEDAAAGEAQMRRTEAIIQSMTKREREKPRSSTRPASGALPPAAAPGWKMSTGCSSSLSRCRR